VGWSGRGDDRVVTGTVAGGTTGGLARGDLQVDGATIDGGFRRDASGLAAGGAISARGVAYGSLGATTVNGQLSSSADGSFGVSGLAATGLRSGDTTLGNGSVGSATVRPGARGYDLSARQVALDDYGSVGGLEAAGASAAGVDRLRATDLNGRFSTPLPAISKIDVARSTVDARVGLSPGVVGDGRSGARLAGVEADDNQLKLGLAGGVATASAQRLRAERVDLGANGKRLGADLVSLTGASARVGPTGGDAHADALAVDGLTLADAPGAALDLPAWAASAAARVEDADAEVDLATATPLGRVRGDLHVRDNALDRASLATVGPDGKPGVLSARTDRDEVHLDIGGVPVPIPWWAANTGAGVDPPEATGDPEQDWAGPKWGAPPPFDHSAPTVRQLAKGPLKR
ncbi:MAG: hypothetical protein ABMA64_37060, partial [Myxococcota bacterium]